MRAKGNHQKNRGLGAQESLTLCKILVVIDFGLEEQTFFGPKVTRKVLNVPIAGGGGAGGGRRFRTQSFLQFFWLP